MLSPSLRVRDIAQHTIRGVQPRPWTDGFSLMPLVVLNATAGAQGSATPNAVGSWSQVFAAAATAPSDTISAILLCISADNAAAAADNSALVDVAIGASGSEQIIASDIAFAGLASGSTGGGRSVLLPVRFSGNTRVAYRVRVATASRNFRVAASANASAALFTSEYADRLPTSLDTIGTSQTTSSGTACSGASGTWTELTASTSKDYQALVLVPSGPGNGTAVTAAQGRLDLGVGASGSEVQIASISVQLAATTGLQVALPGTAFGLAGRHIPAGSRLAIRHNLASTPEALCGCVIGVPYA